MSAEAVSAETILAVLRRLGQGPEHERATVGELVDKLDERAHALVLLLLAAPNLTPGPSMPGFSTIFGVPLCIVAFEMIMGRRALRLPRFLARISIPRRRIASFIVKLEPLLQRIERVLKPRRPDFGSLGATRGIGVACVFLAVLLSLPIPVFSLLPALALVIVALGLLARDGIAVICGLGLGLLACGILTGLVLAARHLLPVS
ncbi:MAG TPA: exopolysaccharide biosynthesis protein [Alphaproteobacteria bacterium]|nr:exopolysaccharide biosynthesis protein [Alphaproteobacteria bacterium]